MEQESFEKLTNGWKNATDRVLGYEEINPKVLGDLFKDTFLLIKKHSTETMIPRALYQALWEMNDFHWWVINSEETPVHFLCQEITGLVTELNYFVIRGWTNELDIQYLITKIEGDL